MTARNGPRRAKKKNSTALFAKPAVVPSAAPWYIDPTVRESPGRTKGRYGKMKLEKILNSGLGIVLALLVFLAAGRTVRVLSWSLARTCGTLILGGIAVYAVSRVFSKG